MYNFFAPYNSFDSMKGNYRRSNDFGADKVYNFTHNEQSSWSGLKTYLASKLAWNSTPTNAEWNGWIDGFFENMYGDGATQMKGWFNSFLSYSDGIKNKFNVEDAVVDDSPYASIYLDVTTSEFFSKDILEDWIDFSANALNALNNSDPNYAVYRDNIYLEQLSPLYLMLEIYGETLSNQDKNKYSIAFTQNAQALNVQNLSLHENIQVAIDKYSQLTVDETVLASASDVKSATELFGDGVVSVKNGMEEVLVSGNVNISTVGEYVLIVKYLDNSVRYVKLLVADKVIRNVSDLASLKFDGTNNVTGIYYLANDIDGEGAVISGAGYKWNQNTGFCGNAIFDGLGHTISNITVNGWGIFGTLGVSTVKNVNFAGITLGSGNSVLLAKNMYNTKLENVNVNFSVLNNNYGLLVADQTGTGSRLTDVAITVDSVVTNAFGKQIDLSTGSNGVKFTNVTLTARAGTTLGTGGNGAGLDDPLASITGVTFNEITGQNYTIDTKFYAENNVATLKHPSMLVGDTITYNSEVYTVTTKGEITITLTGLTLGVNNEVVLGGFNTYTFSNVFAVTKLIKTFEELSVLDYNGTTNITGYYLLANDIDGSASTLNANNPNVLGNSGKGFMGTFDGNNNTISNFTITGSGIFGNLGGGSFVKNVNFTDVSLGNGYYSSGFAPLIARVSYGTIQNVNVTFSSVKAMSAEGKEGGLIVARQTGASAKFINVNINASNLIVDCVLGQEVLAAATYTNYVVSVNGIKYHLGYTGTGANNPFDEKAGVTIVAPKVEDINTLAAAVDGEPTVTLTHQDFTVDLEVNVTLNGVTDNMVVTEDGQLTLTLSDFGISSLGKYTATCEFTLAGAPVVYNFTDVYNVTKILTSLNDFSALNNVNGRVGGYYILSGNIGGSWTNYDGGAINNWSKNASAKAFTGTIDGRGYSVNTNFQIKNGSNGLFGSTLDATIKNISFTSAHLYCSDTLAPLFAKTMYNTTVENVSVKLIEYNRTKDNQIGVFAYATTENCTFRDITIDANGLSMKSILGRAVNANTISSISNFNVINATAIEEYGTSDNSGTTRIAKPSGMTTNVPVTNA